MYTTVIIVILAVTALVFAACKINKEAKTDDIEKEISQIEKKNRKSAIGSKGLFITCDFCGERFNTLSNSSCPGCGGKIHKEESSVIKNYTAGYSPEQSTTPPKKNFSIPTEIFKSDKSTKSLSPALIIFVVVCVLISGVAYLAGNLDTNDYGISYDDVYDTLGLETNDEYDDFSTDYEIPDGYVEADYIIADNSTIYDDGEILIFAKGFYTLEEDMDGEEKTILQYYMKNNSDFEVNIQFKYSVTDGTESSAEVSLISGESCSGYSFVLPSDTVQVEKLSVNRISVYNTDNKEYIYNSEEDDDFEPVIITTDLYSEAQ